MLHFSKWWLFFFIYSNCFFVVSFFHFVVVVFPFKYILLSFFSSHLNFFTFYLWVRLIFFTHTKTKTGEKPNFSLAQKFRKPKMMDAWTRYHTVWEWSQCFGCNVCHTKWGILGGQSVFVFLCIYGIYFHFGFLTEDKIEKKINYYRIETLKKLIRHLIEKRHFHHFVCFVLLLLFCIFFLVVVYREKTVRVFIFFFSFKFTLISFVCIFKLNSFEPFVVVVVFFKDLSNSKKEKKRKTCSGYYSVLLWLIQRASFRLNKTDSRWEKKMNEYVL